MRKSVLLAALLLALALAAVPALAQVVPEEPEAELGGDVILGYVTSISGDRILVEEDPAISFSDGSPLLPGGDKGYFTVVDETSILRLQGGALVPASLDDLEIGQLVSATYEGAVATSYPGQGMADSIVILDELPGNGDAGFLQYDNAT